MGHPVHRDDKGPDVVALAQLEEEPPDLRIGFEKRRLEILVQVAHAEKKRDRRGRLERGQERRLQHLVLLGLVDPHHLAVRDDRLAFGLEKLPAHSAGTLESDRSTRLERPAESAHLDLLDERRREVGCRVVALLEARHDLRDIGSGALRCRKCTRRDREHHHQPRSENPRLQTGSTSRRGRTSRPRTPSCGVTIPSRSIRSIIRAARL